MSSARHLLLILLITCAVQHVSAQEPSSGSDVTNTSTGTASTSTSSAPTALPTASSSTVPSAAPTTQSDLEDLTWASIRITVLASFVLSFLLLTVFELARRSQTVGEVFDRKRETRPDRTPPKLMTSSGGMCGWVWHIGEYLFVDGYVDGNYAAHVKQLQDGRGRKGGPAAANDADDADIEEENSEESPEENKNGNGKEQVSSLQLEPKAPPSKWRFFFVRAGSSIGTLQGTVSKKTHGPASSTYFRKLSNDKGWRRSIASGGGGGEAAAAKAKPPRWKSLLRFVPVLNPLSLTESDRELLRCIGLDSYVMIRFLRLGFEVTFWPFLVACVTLIPTYVTNDYDGGVVQVESNSTSGTSQTGFSTSTTQGYFSISINKIQNSSNKLFVVWFYAIFYYLVVLRRLWVEWIVFVGLREDFLANGDPSAIKEDDAESLKQFRNTCIVEYIPNAHRRDKDIQVFFETLFPNTVRRAEIILQSSALSDLIQERQGYIEAYENVEAKMEHERREYNRSLSSNEQGKQNRFQCRKKKARELKFRVDGTMCCSGKVLPGSEALVLYQAKIVDVNVKIKKEFDEIVRRKRNTDSEGTAFGSTTRDNSNASTRNALEHIESVSAPGSIVSVSGEEDIEGCENGFVEFKTRSAKQAALQMNLTGLSGYFETKQAPDPRDIIWRNMPASRFAISHSKVVVQGFLIIGILFWSALTGLIGSIETAVNSWADKNNETSVALIGFVAGYIPILLLIGLMALLPLIFEALAIFVIRFRTHSEANKFVLKWNFMYRIANFMVILVSGTLYNALLNVQDNAAEVVESIASGLLIQSQFFFNLIITTVGTTTSLQLSQFWSVLYWVIVKGIITEEALSERKLQALRVPKEYFFGYYTAEHMYILMIALVYAPTVPLMMGTSSLYFYVASKTFTHQSLYVYSQKYEGGGRVFYSVSRTTFVIIYASIVIFTAVMALKEKPILAAVFFVFMTLITILVDRAISSRYSRMSKKLPLSRARVMDVEYETLLEKEKTSIPEQKCLPSVDITTSFVGTDRRKMLVKQARPDLNISLGMGIGQPGLGEDDDDDDDDDKGSSLALDYFLYRQPDLHRRNWETKPRPYRSNEAN